MTLNRYIQDEISTLLHGVLYTESREDRNILGFEGRASKGNSQVSVQFSNRQ